jgi:hypothetical protein
MPLKSGTIKGVKDYCYATSRLILERCVLYEAVA